MALTCSRSQISHELQRLTDGLVGNNIQIGRLLQLHRQRLLQRAIKYRVARGIHKVGEQN
jgi:hypothetical protein